MTYVDEVLFGEQNAERRKRCRRLLNSISEIDSSIKQLTSISQGSLIWQAAYWLDDSLFKIDWGNKVPWSRSLSFLRLERVISDFRLQMQQRLLALKNTRMALIEDIGRSAMQSDDLAEEHVAVDPIDKSFTQRMLFRPSWVYRFLLPATGYSLFMYGCLRIGMRLDWKELWTGISEVYSACSHLLQDWVISPINDIWRTIRYRSSNLALVSTAALEADVKSLERMVVDFASRQYPEIPSESVISQVRQGDVTLLLRRYEEQLRSPIKNMLTGDLIGMLLIQVQKSKVDLEVAMMAMDRLLKANELNFELLAIIPLLTLLYLLSGLGWRWIKRITDRSDEHRFAEIRGSIHEIERVLNRVDLEPLFSFGDVVVHCDSIMTQWILLSSSIRTRYDGDFKADLAELLSTRITNERKLWTIARMFHFYSFLYPATY